MNSIQLNGACKTVIPSGGLLTLINHSGFAFVVHAVTAAQQDYRPVRYSWLQALYRMIMTVCFIKEKV